MEEKKKLIQINNLSMRYKLPLEKVDNLKEYFIKKFKRQLKYKDFWVLNDINLTVKEGESLALIGRNGAGKSTLLRLIAGIMEPTKGYIETNGNLVPLLKLGAGFDGNATGRENIFLNGALLGFSKKEMEAKFDSIVKFSELEKFINIPLKNYSSGMLTRLGFAIAVDVKPDILLIDEILAVGDLPFQQKCAKKIEDLQKNGTTFIIVTHSMNQVEKLCQKCLWLKNGKAFMYGDAKEVSTAFKLDCEKNPTRENNF